MLRSKSDIFNDYLHFSYSSLSEKGREGERWRGLRKGKQKGKENMGRGGGKEKRISEGVVEGGGEVDDDGCYIFPNMLYVRKLGPIASGSGHLPFSSSSFPSYLRLPRRLPLGGGYTAPGCDRQTDTQFHRDRRKDKMENVDRGDLPRKAIYSSM